MTPLLKPLTAQLPLWARADHPLLRYELARQRGDLTLLQRALRLGLWVLIISALLLFGALFSAVLLGQPVMERPTTRLWQVIYVPLVAFQVVAQILALSLGVGAVNRERRNQTWDNLRATTQGTEMTLRTRWASILFYRLRGALLVIYLGRLALVGAVFVDLMSLHGAYLDLLTRNVTPEVPLVVGILLVAAALTSALLLPLTTLGVETSLGLLISVSMKNTTFATLFQVIVILLRVGLTAMLLAGVVFFLTGALPLDDGTAWGLLMVHAAIGDWGLMLMQLGMAGNLWALIPYGVFFGAVLLLFTALQAWLADVLLDWAVRRAERE